MKFSRIAMIAATVLLLLSAAYFSAQKYSQPVPLATPSSAMRKADVDVMSTTSAETSVASKPSMRTTEDRNSIGANASKPVAVEKPVVANATSFDLEAYARLDAKSAEHLAWLKRNGYPDDAHAELLLAMDLNSLRLQVAQGDLAAQSELAYRLSADPQTQSDAAELFRDAAVKGSKEALVRAADSLEHGGMCTRVVEVSAWLQLAVMLGDLGATPKYVQCARAMNPQQHGASLLLAARLFADLNAESMRRYQRPLRIDRHPLSDDVIARIVAADKPAE